MFFTTQIKLYVSGKIINVINPLVADRVRFRTEAARDEIYIVNKIIEIGFRHLTLEN